MPLRAYAAESRFQMITNNDRSNVRKQETTYIYDETG